MSARRTIGAGFAGRCITGVLEAMQGGRGERGAVWKLGPASLLRDPALRRRAGGVSGDRRKSGAGDKAGGAGKAADARALRLAEALRANLQKRKAQARARRHGEPDERPMGLGAGDNRGEDAG